MIVERDIIINALEDAGADEDALREDYSGRGMYGKSCFGIVGSLSDFTRFVVALTDATHDNDDIDIFWIDNVRSDNMGRDTIFYFPGVTIE